MDKRQDKRIVAIYQQKGNCVLKAISHDHHGAVKTQWMQRLSDLPIPLTLCEYADCDAQTLLTVQRVAPAVVYLDGIHDCILLGAEALGSFAGDVNLFFDALLIKYQMLCKIYQ